MNIQTSLLQMHTQLKVYHWQTKSYARHMAFGTAYDAMTPLIDSFMESYLGTLEERLPTEAFETDNITNDGASKFVLNAITTLKNIRSQVEEYPDLVNMADEMIGVLGTLKYLLTLK